MSREGNLEAPTRHALDWQNPDFYHEESLNHELDVYLIFVMVAAVVSVCAIAFQRCLIWLITTLLWKWKVLTKKTL